MNLKRRKRKNGQPWISRIYDAKKNRPNARLASSLLIFRAEVNTWVIGYYFRGKFKSTYSQCAALYWMPLPPDDRDELATLISAVNSATVP